MQIFILVSTTVAMCLFIAYLLFTVTFFGFPTSLSKTYYQLEAFDKNKGWLFQVTLFSIAILLLPAWLEVLDGSDYQFLAFLSCVGLIFVAAAPKFLNSFESKVHYVSTAIAALCALLYVIFINSDYQLMLAFTFITLVVYIIVDYKKKNIFYWLELIAFF